jgi:hypothetical protein
MLVAMHSATFGYIPPPLFAAPAELQSQQWFYFAFREGDGWVHVITMPANVPIEAIDQVVLLALNPHAYSALDRGLYDKNKAQYEYFVRIAP